MVKKGQLKIQQMAFMLMAVTLFFVLAGLFVMVFAYSGLKESATNLEENNALLLVTKLSNSPEFSCGNSYDTIGTNCVDSDKLIAILGDMQTYEGFWGKQVSSVEVRKIYPANQTEKVCNLINYPNCNVIRILSENITGTYLTNYVSLCRKDSYEGEIYDKCEIARILVGYTYEQ
jgi:hypothetical protein